MLLRVGTGESETAVGGDNDSVDIFTEIRTRKTAGSTVHLDHVAELIVCAHWGYI